MHVKHLRWYIAGLLFLSTVINYVDRQVLSIVAPVVTRELHLTPTEYANILQAFLYAYTAMYLISGVLVDRWGTRVALGVFMAWWSVSNMLHAFVGSALQLGFFRMLLGIGEPGNFMAAAKATSEWFTPKERAFVNGLANGGASVGAIIAPPLVVWLYSWLGWRAAFVITGASGLVWLIAWLLFYRLPQAHPWITAEERQLLAPAPPVSATPTVPPPSYWELLRMRQTWGLFLTRFLSDPVWWFYLFWLPKYLVEQRGFTMVEMGAIAWMPYLTADIGSMSGGVLSGWLIRRNWPVVKARSAGMLPFAMLMPLSMVIAYTPSSLVTMMIICTVTFAHMVWKTNLMTLTNDLYPKAVVGRVAGFAAFGNGLGGAIFTALTGWIVQHFSYNTVFILMGFLHPAAYVLFWLLVGKAPPPENAESIGH
ncbi:MAG: MFS transporter [Acidobacteria bacterium]|nr:MFS transporter [Acidobacteriota bacterium]